MGGDRGNLRERVLRLLSGKQPPLKVGPRHRVSGPVQTPSDWYDPAKQQFLGPQCCECHNNIPVGAELVDGLCGTCAPIPLRPRRANGSGDDFPPAA